MENTTLVALRLEGAMQSWGDHAKWDIRDSGDFPTKSGVVGLLACAMGLERGDPEISALSDNIQIAVRADRPGIKAMDFHTVQGRPRLYTAEGVRTPDKSTIVSTRWYLQDANFLVLIKTNKTWRDRICQSLKSPKWPIYLGRKSYVPSRPVFDRVTTDYRDMMDALHRYPVAERAGELLRYECEIPDAENEAYYRADALLPGNRMFALRKIYRSVVAVKPIPLACKEVRDVSDKN